MSIDTAMTDLINAIKFVDNIAGLGASVETRYNTVAQQGGEFAPIAQAVLDGMRNAGGDLFAPEALRAVFEPYIDQALSESEVNLPRSGSYEVKLARLIRWLVDNGKYFVSRQMTFGTPSAASGASGNGELFRCTVDKYGNPLECTLDETKFARVRQDQLTGASKHREILRFFGTSEDKTPWTKTGSGMIADVETIDALSAAIVTNPSFEDNGASADDEAPVSTTQINGWTVQDVADWRMRTNDAYIYKGYQGSDFATLWGLEMILPSVIKQRINLQNPGFAYDKDIPYFCGIRYKRLAGATGNPVFALGASSVTESLAGKTTGVWNHLYLPMDSGLYYRQFGAQNDIFLSFSCPDLAVGTIAIDDIVHGPMVNVDGTYYIPVGGDTPFLNDYQFDWLDSVPSGVTALVSYWLWRSFPSNATLQALGSWIPTTPTASLVSFAEA